MKTLSSAQEFAAWKAAGAKKDLDRAEKSLADRINSGYFKGCKQGMGRGWKKWAKKISPP